MRVCGKNKKLFDDANEESNHTPNYGKKRNLVGESYILEESMYAFID